MPISIYYSCTFFTNTLLILLLSKYKRRNSKVFRKRFYNVISFVSHLYPFEISKAKVLLLKKDVTSFITYKSQNLIGKYLKTMVSHFPIDFWLSNTLLYYYRRDLIWFFCEDGMLDMRSSNYLCRILLL